MRKPLIVIPLVLLVLLAFSFVPARAFETNDDGVIAVDQVINDDLFIAAEKVVINGTVNGNAFVNAAEVIVNGPVNGNLMVFGAIVEVNAPVSGSVGFVGQSLELNSRVDGSLFAAGVSLVVNPQAEIGLNLYFFGYSVQNMMGSQVGVDASLACYQAVLQGEIGRNVHGGLGALELDGVVGGDVHIEVEAPGEPGFSMRIFLGPNYTDLPDGIPSGIRVSETATVGGNLTYTSPAEQSNAIGLPDQQVVFELLTVNEKPTPAQAVRERLLFAGHEFVTLLILGALALWLLRKPLLRSERAARQVLPALGWGIVVLLVTPLTVLLLGTVIAVVSLLLGVVTLGGLSVMAAVGGYLVLALAVLALLVALFYASKLIVAMAVGGWLCRRFASNCEANPFWPLLLGIALYIALSMIPFVGDVFAIFVTLMGLGAMWMAFRQRGLPLEPSAATFPVEPDEPNEVA